MGLLLWIILLGISTKFYAAQILLDTPSPPVILEEGEQYLDGEGDQYVDYEYNSLIEQQLKDIHTRLFNSQEDSTVAGVYSTDAGVSSESDIASVLGVEITAVVSHSPRAESESQEDRQEDRQEDYHLDNSILGGSNETTPSQTSPVSKEKLDDLTLAFNWWQILLLVLACLLLTSLCCYFSGCCFLVADCCSDPFWGCCPCCRGCVRLVKRPSTVGSRLEGKDRKAPSSYSLNENNTAPRTSIERSSISLTKVEQGSTRSVNGIDKRTDEILPRKTSELKSSTPVKPDRRTSRESNLQNSLNSAQDDSLPSTSSIRSVRNYRRLSQTNSFKNSSSQGLGRTNSLQGSSKAIGRTDDSLRRGRKESVLRGEPSQDWVYEDSSGYFSWISKLGSSKKKQYQIYAKKKPTSSQKVTYRQSKYHHIAESRNSAVIPVKISKRASNASNFALSRPVRCRSVESFSSEDESVEPFLQTKSEKHIPSRLSTNLADLENRRARRQSGGNTAVPCPTVPQEKTQPPPTPGETYNLKLFEKSLLSSKETTL